LDRHRNVVIGCRFFRFFSPLVKLKLEFPARSEENLCGRNRGGAPDLFSALESDPITFSLSLHHYRQNPDLYGTTVTPFFFVPLPFTFESRSKVCKEKYYIDKTKKEK
jgi:hypothetical protein